MLEAVQGVIDYLRTLEHFGFLDQKLPLLDLSVSDLLKATDDLAARIEAFQRNPAQSLQAIEELLEDAIGLVDPAGNPNFDNPEVELSFDRTIAASPALKVELQFRHDYDGGPRSMNLDLAKLVGLVSGDAAAALAGVTNLIDVGGTAVMQIQAGARFDLDFGLDLSGGAAPVPFLYDTHAGCVFDAAVLGSNIRFKAAIGPVGVFIGNATQAGTATLDRDGNPQHARSRRVHRQPPRRSGGSPLSAERAVDEPRGYRP